MARDSGSGTTYRTPTASKQKTASTTSSGTKSGPVSYSTYTYDPTKQTSVPIGSATVQTAPQTMSVPVKSPTVGAATPIKGGAEYSLTPPSVPASYGGGGYSAPQSPNVTSAPAPAVATGGPAVATPAAPPSVVGSQIVDAGTFDQGTLNQILTALEAQYGLTREQLLADQSEIGQLYRFVQSNLNGLERNAMLGVQENSLSRGVLRSGIHLENASRVEQDFAQRRAQAEAEKATKLGYIQRQLAELEAELLAERNVTAQGVGQQGLQHSRVMVQSRL
jgi:hypothetical protein